MPRLQVDAAGTRKALRNLDSAVEKAARAAVNRTAAGMKALAARRASERYPLSSRVLGAYIHTKKTADKAAEVEVRPRPLPLSKFPVRVETIKRGKRKFFRITVQRLRGGGFIEPAGDTKAFPLHQRRAGKLRAGDQVWRRAGSARMPLRRVSGSTFGKRFLQTILLPEIRIEVPLRFAKEFRSAFGALSARG